MSFNNEVKIDAWEGHPWYPAVLRASEQLTREVPGYRIDQIKEKFNGLRFYITLPDELDTEEYQAKADRIISYALGWVDGFEYYEEKEN